MSHEMFGVERLPRERQVSPRGLHAACKLPGSLTAERVRRLLIAAA